MAEDTLSSEYYWDNVVFKVEDKLFCVPRCEFVRSSEVFADMFTLPSGGTTRTEGQDRAHPIELEGYKKDEFACLLKVMYPTAGSLISGTKLDLCLEKEEWVSVLKLSTVWNMTKIRNYAIHRLSIDVVLSPVEKILIARAHKVATWLSEGVTSLASGDARPTLQNLATLGWETAARILWIRDNLSLTTSNNTLRFGKDAIKCAQCPSPASLIIGTHNCSTCGTLLPDIELTFPGPGLASGTDRLVLFGGIMCQCGAKPFYSSGVGTCGACSRGSYHNYNIRVTPNNKEVMIKEMFGGEINDYELAMTVA